MRTLHFTDRELGRLENVVQREIAVSEENIRNNLKEGAPIDIKGLAVWYNILEKLTGR